MGLFSRTVGDTGPLVVFCHGLLGQGRNWTTIAKAVAADGFRCLLVDLPDHGRSPWSPHVDYDAMAAAVATELGGEPAAWVGHSMGAKVAMRAALTAPDLVSRLVVADMSPVRYDGATSRATERQVRALAGLDLDALSDRADADRALAERVDDPGVRAFLLQNVRREGGGWRVQANLDVLLRDLPTILDWPESTGHYDGPTLWLSGAESGYVQPEHDAVMHRLFPAVRSVTIKHAGHWVHSEQPEVVIAVLRRFLAPELGG